MRDLHPGQLPFECSICDKGFVSERQVKLHFKEEHTGKTRNYTCEPCEKSYETESQLKIHVNKIHKINLKNKPGCKKKKITNFTMDSQIENAEVKPENRNPNLHIINHPSFILP